MVTVISVQKRQQSGQVQGGEEKRQCPRLGGTATQKERAASAGGASPSRPNVLLFGQLIKQHLPRPGATRGGGLSRSEPAAWPGKPQIPAPQSPLTEPGMKVPETAWLPQHPLLQFLQRPLEGGSVRMTLF